MEQWIDSVGIDVGTSTTKWIHTRLELKHGAPGGQLPRYGIGRRIIEYRSPMFTTPLGPDGGIDAQALAVLLRAEYARAGIAQEQVETGAVIVTGETATRHNAEAVVQGVARVAGHFVAAAAGADLEALLAGIGSGARDYSRSTPGMVANVDIGGGTANIVYFCGGETVATATLHIGGKLARLDHEGKLLGLSPAISRWLEERTEACDGGQPAQQAVSSAGTEAAAGNNSLPAVKVGTSPGLEEYRKLAMGLAELLLGCVMGAPQPLQEAALLFVGPPPSDLPQPAEIWVSGGVGALLQAEPPESMASAARYGDLGPLPAEAINRVAGRGFPVPVRPAPEAARATVIGAGAYSTQIGGATMYAAPGLLPLYNIPVVLCSLDRQKPADAGQGERAEGKDEEVQLPQALEEAVRRGLLLYGEAGGNPAFALALRITAPCSYRRLAGLAGKLAELYTREPLDEQTAVLVCSQDMAKALGYALLARLGEGGAGRLVCLDQLEPGDGDYLDIGAPLKEDVVPVVIKSLIFEGASS